MTPQIQTHELDDQPPSAKLVYLVLQEADEPQSQADLRKRTRLPNRTVRFAVNRLQELGLIEERRTAGDARQKCYSIEDTGNNARQ